MPRRAGRDLTVGALFTLGLIIIAAAIMAVGQESRLFGAKAYYRVVFPNTDGLAEGSPVKMAGVRIGAVSGVHLPQDPSRPGIEVEVGVDRAYAGRVRQDSRAALRTEQYLTGEKSVEIMPGSPEMPALDEGSVIEPSQDTEILEQVGLASQNLSDITISLKNILGALESGEGLIGQMIHDPEFGLAGLEAMRGAFENLQALGADIRSGRGFVGRLMYDDTFAAKIDDLGRTLDGVAEVVARLERGEGALGALLQEGGEAEAMIADLQATVASLRGTAAALERETGLVGRLLHDEAYAETLARDLQATLGNVAEITGKINRGEGTLGALVNQATVHDGLEDILAGINDSKFARWLLRHYQKKGIKQRTQDLEETPDGQGQEEGR